MTDPLGVIVSPLETITRERENMLRPTLRRITELARQQDAGLIVLGLPLNMDGSTGERALKTMEFGELLAHRLEAERLEIPIVFQDERLSTAEADGILKESGVVRSQRKNYIDRIAAAVILEDYLREHPIESSRKGETDGRP